MKIIADQEYQITSVEHDTVRFGVAYETKYRYAGQMVFNMGHLGVYFSESGENVRVKNGVEVLPFDWYLISPVDENKKWRKSKAEVLRSFYAAGQILASPHALHVFETGEASDEVIAQAEKASREVQKLIKMLGLHS